MTKFDLNKVRNLEEMVEEESGDILLPLFLYIMHVVVHYIYVKEICAVKKGERNEH